MDLQKQDSLYIKGFMSEKKSHEVNVMASLCDALAKKNSIQMVFLCLLFYEFSKKKIFMHICKNWYPHLFWMECNLMRCVGIIGIFWPYLEPIWSLSKVARCYVGSLTF